MLGRFTVQILKAAHGSAWSAAVRRQHSEYGDPVRRHDASAQGANGMCWNLQVL
jgi:hypothetical protein